MVQVIDIMKNESKLLLSTFVVYFDFFLEALHFLLHRTDLFNYRIFKLCREVDFFNSIAFTLFKFRKSCKASSNAIANK